MLTAQISASLIPGGLTRGGGVALRTAEMGEKVGKQPQNGPQMASKWPQNGPRKGNFWPRPLRMGSESPEGRRCVYREDRNPPNPSFSLSSIEVPMQPDARGAPSTQQEVGGAVRNGVETSKIGSKGQKKPLSITNPGLSEPHLCPFHPISALLTPTAAFLAPFLHFLPPFVHLNPIFCLSNPISGYPHLCSPLGVHGAKFGLFQPKFLMFPALGMHGSSVKGLRVINRG